MHSAEIQNRFLELRAKGMSLARIAEKIGVCKRTLVDWNHTRAQELLSLRALELEALNEKLLATREHELKWMTQMLRKPEDCLLERELKFQSTGDVWRILTYLRAELDKRRREPEAGLVSPDEATRSHSECYVPSEKEPPPEMPTAPLAEPPPLPPAPENDHPDEYNLPTV